MNALQHPIGVHSNRKHVAASGRLDNLRVELALLLLTVCDTNDSDLGCFWHCPVVRHGVSVWVYFLRTLRDWLWSERPRSES